jgi:hypothetical protein
MGDIKTEPLNGKYWTIGDVDRLRPEELFTSTEIEERRKEMKESIRKSIDKIYKSKYGNEF